MPDAGAVEGADGAVGGPQHYRIAGADSRSWNPSSSFPNFVENLILLPALPGESMTSKRRKLLWFLLFAAAVGWFAKDGTTQLATDMMIRPW